MIVLGGYLVACEFERVQFPVISDPSEQELVKALSELRYKSGVLGLQVKPTPDVGAYELVVYSENGNFLVMLNQYLEDGEHEVSTLRNAGVGEGLVSFLGELYPAKAVTSDFDLVCRASNDFLHSRNISTDIWG